MDSLCLKILELDGLTLVEHEHSDGEADMDEQVSLFFCNTPGRKRISGLIVSCLGASTAVCAGQELLHLVLS